MTQIIEDIRNSVATLGGSLGSFFGNSQGLIIRAIIIYCLLVIIMRGRLYYSRKTLTSANTLFGVSMDNLYYQVSLILYNNKSTIYDFQSNIPLLLQYKTQEISKRGKANYYQNYNKLIEEIEYISQLTNTPLSYNRTELDEQHRIVASLDHTTNYIHNIYLIITVGIGKLFI